MLQSDIDLIHQHLKPSNWERVDATGQIYAGSDYMGTIDKVPFEGRWLWTSRCHGNGAHKDLKTTVHILRNLYWYHRLEADINKWSHADEQVDTSVLE